LADASSDDEHHYQVAQSTERDRRSARRRYTDGPQIKAYDGGEDLDVQQTQPTEDEEQHEGRRTRSQVHAPDHHLESSAAVVADDEDDDEPRIPGGRRSRISQIHHSDDDEDGELPMRRRLRPRASQSEHHSDDELTSGRHGRLRSRRQAYEEDYLRPRTKPSRREPIATEVLLTNPTRMLRSGRQVGEHYSDDDVGTRHRRDENDDEMEYDRDGRAYSLRPRANVDYRVPPPLYIASPKKSQEARRSKNRYQSEMRSFNFGFDS
jgi:hypothetical protein